MTATYSKDGAIADATPSQATGALSTGIGVSSITSPNADHTTSVTAGEFQAARIGGNALAPSGTVKALASSIPDNTGLRYQEATGTVAPEGTIANGYINKTPVTMKAGDRAWGVSATSGPAPSPAPAPGPSPAPAPAPGPAPSGSTQPGWFSAPSTAATVGTQGFITNRNVYGANGGKAGQVNVTTTAGNFAWFAFEALQGTPNFHDDASGFSGGFSNQGVVTGADGNPYTLFRADYVNSYPSVSSITTS